MTNSDASAKDTLCIIVHFGNPEDTLECVNSLSQDAPIDIVIVDNDPKQSFILPSGPSHNYRVIRSGGSMSFAEANNLGAEVASQNHHQFVLLLNNDTVIEQGAITTLKSAFNDNTVGVAGPAVPFYDHPDALWACGGKVSKWAVTIDGIRRFPDTPVAVVDYVPGAALMTRMSLWSDIGGLPTRYFLAFEEAEYALEAKKRGFATVVVPAARILHKVGMSSDRQPMYYYNTVRNRMRFGRYLFGAPFGVLLGALSGLVRSYTPMRLRLWLIAVSEELSGRPLDQAALFSLRDRFRR